jgi:HSP20 family protein
MSELTVWKNQEMVKMRKDIDQLFSRMWSDFGKGFFTMGALSMDLSETKDSLVLKAELPGVDLEDVKITVTNRALLTINGEKREESVEEGARFHKVERKFGSFTRTIPLPCRVEADRVKATYKKGILTITLPKCEPETEGIEVEVK